MPRPKAGSGPPPGKPQGGYQSWGQGCWGATSWGLPRPPQPFLFPSPGLRTHKHVRAARLRESHRGLISHRSRTDDWGPEPPLQTPHRGTGITQSALPTAYECGSRARFSEEEAEWERGGLICPGRGVSETGPGSPRGAGPGAERSLLGPVPAAPPTLLNGPSRASCLFLCLCFPPCKTRALGLTRSSLNPLAALVLLGSFLAHWLLCQPAPCEAGVSGA